MLFRQTSSPHITADNNVSRIMLHVILALVPGIIASLVIFGWGILINLLTASTTALACEALILAIRRRPVTLFLRDNSALVTAMLLALALPPLAPWWLTVVSTAFAIVIAKQLYGGIGYNPFNPAMIGYVVALISFPAQMTRWPAPFSKSQPGLVESLQIHFSGAPLDAITAATPLDTIKTQLGQNFTLSEITQGNAFGMFAGLGWEWIGLAFLLGGCWLLFMKVIQWQIPAAMLGALSLLAMLFHGLDPDTYSPPLLHLFSGGAMLGAFFIATDPVTAAASNRGRLIYGAGIGILTYVIRTWGGYPDGIAFAVLLMNMAVPTIDYYTRPKAFGER